MTRQSLERRTPGVVDVDLCRRCRAIWFDARESLQLTSAGVLALFRAMQVDDGSAPFPLPARLPCPRCGSPLAKTEDVQRRTRFAYWRCTRGHGRLTPFAQFLREKDFVRPLGDEELARLKSAVRIIRCPGCGAPVDLERSTACTYCRSPLLALDPGAIAARPDELARSATPAAAPDVDRLVDAMLEMERERRRQDAGATGESIVDLLDLGVTALVRLLEPR